MRRLAAALVAAVALCLPACGFEPTTTWPATSARTPVESAGVSATAVPASPGAASPAVPMVTVEPGRPYHAAAILDAMRASTRPGGVSDEMATETVAAAVAEMVWTWDGRPYPILQVGGTCGPTTCSLELAGSPPGAAGPDLYVFEVVPRDAVVRLQAADLHGYPAALDGELDALVRAIIPPADLLGLALAGAAWQPPPDEAVMVAAYRSGGEEGAPAVDVVVDVEAGAVLDVREP